MSRRPRRLSAGVVVLRDTPEGYRFLLLRAYQHWDFPKGMVERGEAPLDAARREVREETTIEDLDFRWGETFYETPPYNRGKVARYYMAATDQVTVELPVNPQTGQTEHSEYRWVTPEEAWEMVTPRVHGVLRWAGEILGRPVATT